jgi:hypothetical protein
MSSIRKEISAHTLFAEMRLVRAVFNGSLLLVEGDIDWRVLRLFVDASLCKPVICINKSNVLGAVDLIDRARFRGAVAVVDDDYDHLLGRRVASQNLCYTDANDLEGIIFRSGALEKVLLNYGSEAKIGKLESHAGLPLREILYEQAAAVGAMRLAAKRRGWNIRFAGMHYAFSSNGAFVIEAEAVAKHLTARSAGENCESDELLNAARVERAAIGSNLSLCNGDDLLRVLARAFKKEIGSYNHFEVCQDDLTRVLCVAFDRTSFSATGIHGCLKAWEARNHPFRVLS